MLISEIYNRIRNFAVLALNNPLVAVGFEGFIGFSNQDATRPEKPFIMINIGRFSQVDGHILNDIDDNGVQQVVTQKSFTVTFEAYTDDLHDALNLLNFLENALYTQLAYNVFRSDLASMRTINGVTDISEPAGATIESRAILEVEFRVSQSTSSDVGLIEHIHITNEDTDEEIIINR